MTIEKVQNEETKFAGDVLAEKQSSVEVGETVEINEQDIGRYHF